jgi:hypothetical protein
MLTNDIEAVDLVTERSKLKDLIPAEVQEYFIMIKMTYTRCIIRFCNILLKKSLSLDKTPVFKVSYQVSKGNT